MGRRAMATVARLWVLLLLALAMPATAQPSPIDAATGQLTTAETALNAVDRALDTRTDRAARGKLRDDALGAQSAAREAADQLRGQLALVDARIAGLGPPVAGVVEAADIRNERRALALARNSLDSKVKRGQLIAVEAGQLVTEIDQTLSLIHI